MLGHGLHWAACASKAAMSESLTPQPPLGCNAASRFGRTEEYEWA